MSPRTKAKKNNSSWLTGIALFVVAAIVPIIVRAAFVALPPETSSLFHNMERYGDVFSYHKSVVLIICACVIVFHSLSELLFNLPDSMEMKAKIAALSKDPVIIITGIYILFVIISNIFSQYTHTALFGLHDRREGLFVQMAYIIVFLSAMAYTKNKDNTKILLIGLLCSSLIMGAIGFSQFINRDFFSTYFAGWLITGIRYHQAPGSDEIVRFSVTPGFTIAYGTNFNPNTFGKVTAMLTPLLFAAAIISKKLVLRVLFILAGALMFIGIIASRSVGGLIGGATATAVIILTLLLHYLSQKGVFNRKAAITIAIAVVVALGSGFAMRNFIYDNLFFTLGRITAIFEPPAQDHLPQFEFEGSRLTMTERGHIYHIDFTEAGDSPVLTLAGASISPSEIMVYPGTQTAFEYVFEVPNFRDIRVSRLNNVYNYRGLNIAVINGQINFVNHVNMDFINPNETIPSFGFEGWETWGSNRGFIFARSIPLLRESIIIGSGSDTFVLRFPQHDLIGKIRYFETPVIIIDKAHNLYLQTALTTGLISVIALIALFGYYIISTFFSLIRKNSQDFCLRLGLLASVSAYAVASLSTDSTVSSAPIFWIILAMGFALNRKNAAEVKK